MTHATPEELTDYEQMLETELAHRSPADFADVCTNGEFLRPAHINLINEVLVALVNGTLLKPDGTKYKKAMVSTAPRHGKSHLLSRFTPAWYLAQNPVGRVGLISYGADFAAGWGRAARDILRDAPAHISTPLRKDVAAADSWQTVAGGGMVTAGSDGVITGKGFNLLLVDDPVKGYAESQSKAMREKIWTTMLGTIMTRLEPGGVVIMVMTRWHMDDVAGRFLEQEGDDWYQIILPALAEENDVLGRAPGEALWPERYDEAALAALRATLTPMMWSAEYQQSPFIDGGNIFKGDSLRYYSTKHSDDESVLALHKPDTTTTVSRDKLWTFMIIDTAVSTKTTADYTVMALFGVTPDKELLLLDQFRDRIESHEHMPTLDRLYKQWKPRFVGIERATYGLALIQTATRLGRIPIIQLKPDFDKVSRAYNATALIESGRLYLPQGAYWLKTWIDEMLVFPNGAHDDCVDVIGYAAHVLKDRIHAPKRPRKPEPTVEDRIMKQIRDKNKPIHPVLGK